MSLRDGRLGDRWTVSSASEEGEEREEISWEKEELEWRSPGGEGILTTGGELPPGERVKEREGAALTEVIPAHGEGIGEIGERGAALAVLAIPAEGEGKEESGEACSACAGVDVCERLRVSKVEGGVIAKGRAGWLAWLAGEESRLALRPSPPRTGEGDWRRSVCPAGRTSSSSLSSTENAATTVSWAELLRLLQLLLLLLLLLLRSGVWEVRGERGGGISSLPRLLPLLLLLVLRLLLFFSVGALAAMRMEGLIASRRRERFSGLVAPRGAMKEETGGRGVSEVEGSLDLVKDFKVLMVLTWLSITLSLLSRSFLRRSSSLQSCWICFCCCCSADSVAEGAESLGLTPCCCCTGGEESFSFPLGCGGGIPCWGRAAGAADAAGAAGSAGAADAAGTAGAAGPGG